MTIDKLREILFQFGNIEVLKEGVEFTLLLSGKELTNSKNYSAIMDAVLDYTRNEYPWIECIKHLKDYLLIVLKKSN